MPKSIFNKKSQTGDTIVEVLLSLAVISAVLGGAFVSARRSLDATIQARERDQAVRLVETQLERLKTVAGSDVNVFSGGPFCLIGSPITKQENLSNCRLDSANNTFGPGSQSIPYELRVERSGAGTSVLFTVIAEWERVGGGEERASVAYRVHQ
jgi:type II secretory pathway pseudopilin PulG